MKKFSIGKETELFNMWFKKKYNWIDRDVKRMMFKAWIARGRVKA